MPTQCSIPGCGKPINARTFCHAHYWRWQQHGDPLGGRPGPGLPVAERFWAKVDKRGPDECWLWTGSKDSRGYGRFYVEGSLGLPTRAAYTSCSPYLGRVKPSRIFTDSVSVRLSLISTKPLDSVFHLCYRGVDEPKGLGYLLSTPSSNSLFIL